MITAKDIIMKNTCIATGCTEPGAIAWACSIAREAIGGKPKKIKVCVDQNVYKNGISVGVPYSNGSFGLEIAASLGVFADSSAFLQLLSTVKEEDKKYAFEIVKTNSVEINIDKESNCLKIEAEVETENGIGKALVKEAHTNLVGIWKNNEAIEVPENYKFFKKEEKAIPFEKLKLEDILKLSADIDEELKTWIWKGIDLNMSIANEGLTRSYGLGVGKKIKSLIDKGLFGNDAINYASCLTAAAIDARMAGATFPVMANSGSGNQGLAAVIPVVAFANFRKIEDKNLIARAVLISHLISIYVKKHTGILSYLCGCTHGAAHGAASGILFLMGRGAKEISQAVKNLTADITGMICDGGKPGCSLKLALGAAESVRTAFFVVEGLHAEPSDGIVGITVEDSIAHIGELSKKTRQADQAIVKILNDYNKSKSKNKED